MVTMNLKVMNKNVRIILNREKKKCKIIHKKLKSDLLFEYRGEYSRLYREYYHFQYKDIYHLYNFIEEILYKVCELLEIDHTIINFINNHINTKQCIFMINTKCYHIPSTNIEYKKVNDKHNLYREFIVFRINKKYNIIARYFKTHDICYLDILHIDKPLFKFNKIYIIGLLLNKILNTSTLYTDKYCIKKYNKKIINRLGFTSHKEEYKEFLYNKGMVTFKILSTVNINIFLENNIEILDILEFNKKSINKILDTRLYFDINVIIEDEDICLFKTQSVLTIINKKNNRYIEIKKGFFMNKVYVIYNKTEIFHE